MTSSLVRFLLVEDDDNHAMIVTRTLQADPVPNVVERVKNGAEALAYLRGGDGFEERVLPNVILLDLKLPKVDGHEVLETLKKDEHLRRIPVVVLTTSAVEGDRARAYYNHANSYLVKPIDFDQFRQMVQDLKVYWGIWNQPAPTPRRGSGPTP